MKKLNLKIYFYFNNDIILHYYFYFQNTYQKNKQFCLNPRNFYN
jgi:hypothetical protein